VTSPQFTTSNVQRCFSLLVCVVWIKGSTGAWDGTPVLIDDCGYTLAEGCVRTGCVCLVTYQGAFVIIRRSFDWYRCKLIY
jgi:hypothetical protein